MNSRNNNDSFEYKRIGTRAATMQSSATTSIASQSSQSRNNNNNSSGFQISTDNYFQNYEPSSMGKGEFGSADSYITPPARQLEQLEYKNSWFHPPKKSKKFVKRDLDSSEMQQISKKLNFFDEQVPSQLQQQQSSSSQSSTQSGSQSQTSSSSNNTAGQRNNEQLDFLTYEQITNTVSILSQGNTNFPTSSNNTSSNSTHHHQTNSIGIPLHKTRSSNTNGNNNNNNNQSPINQNYSISTNNNFTQASNSSSSNNNNRSISKYNKTTSNPESILKFR